MLGTVGGGLKIVQVKSNCIIKKGFETKMLESWKWEQVSPDVRPHQVPQVLIIVSWIASSFSSIRNLLNETIEHCNSRKQFEKNLSEFSLVREQLARENQAQDKQALNHTETNGYKHHSNGHSVVEA